MHCFLNQVSSTDVLLQMVAIEMLIVNIFKEKNAWLVRIHRNNILWSVISNRKHKHINNLTFSFAFTSKLITFKMTTT